MVLFPAFRIAASRGRSVFLHELRSLSRELQLFAGSTEAEVVGKFVEDMGGRRQADALVLLDPVLECLRVRLVLLQLALGLVRLTGDLLRPLLGFLSISRDIGGDGLKGLVCLIPLFLGFFPGFGGDFPGLLERLVQAAGPPLLRLRAASTSSLTVSASLRSLWHWDLASISWRSASSRNFLLSSWTSVRALWVISSAAISVAANRASVAPLICGSFDDVRDVPYLFQLVKFGGVCLLLLPPCRCELARNSASLVRLQEKRAQPGQPDDDEKSDRQ